MSLQRIMLAMIGLLLTGLSLVLLVKGSSDVQITGLLGAMVGLSLLAGVAATVRMPDWTGMPRLRPAQERARQTYTIRNYHTAR